MTKGKQGFASMDPEQGREIARMGGKAQGKHNNPGNFANNPEKARKAGAKGGRISRRPPVASPMPTELRDEVSSI